MPKSADSRQLETTAQVMDALGGIDAVCALTGSRYKNTWGWRHLKAFPSHFFLVMSFALHEKGLGAPPELWGQVTPEDRRSALQAMIEAQKKKVAA